METPIKMDDLRGFPPIFGNTFYCTWFSKDQIYEYDFAEGWPFDRLLPKGVLMEPMANDPGDQLGISWQEYGKAKL